MQADFSASPPSADIDFSALSLSLDAAIATTGRSRRTWWRRITAGQVERQPSARGSRARLALRDVAAQLSVPLSDEQLLTLVRADAGEAQAQAEIGAVFALHACRMAENNEDFSNTYQAAIHWLEHAAAQGAADAMHTLATLHGHCAEPQQRSALLLSQLARAAMAGHLIARAQMQALLQRAAFTA